MLRIYVSSTYEDLKDERRVARDAIQAMGHHAVGMEDYSASDERPLDRCLRDVRSCQAYLGIFAWKYGFCPNEGGTSITQLEYEEARTNNIPRYVFLLREDAAWPRSRIPDKDQPLIKKFRQIISLERLVGFFENASSLGAAVTRSLATTVINPPGKPQIPDMLPYLCNRSDQEYALIKAIKELDKNQDHPLTCIIHGEETEAHDKFLERLQKIMLPSLLPHKTQAAGVQAYLLEWPPSFQKAEETHARFEMSLCKEILDSAVGTKEAINNRLSQYPGPVAIHSHLITENWQRQGTTWLDAYLKFWQEWPDLSVGQMLIVFLFIKYQVNKRLPPHKLRRYLANNTRIRETLNKYDFDRFDRLTAVVLPELKGPTLGEAQDWARSEDIGKFCDRASLVTAVYDYYIEWESQQKSKLTPVRIPTDQLVPKLREMISLTQFSVEKIV